MTPTDRATLLAWDEAVRYFNSNPYDWLTYLDLAIRCHLAGFASPLEVAFGGDEVTSDRDRLRAWRWALIYFRTWELGMSSESSRAYRRVMAQCQLAGFATPMEVARGGRA